MISFDSAILRVSGVDPIGAASSVTSASSASSATALPGANASGALSSAGGIEGGVGGVGGTSAANTPAPASAESAERFRQMLDHATLTIRSNPNGMQGPSAISSVVDSQDAAFNKLSSAVDSFQQNASTMDTREFTATMVRMQFEMADAMTKIQLGVGFAQGGKSAVQNLMKNQ